MTYQEKVNYLKSYKDKYYRWIYLNNKLEGVKAISYQESTNGPKKSVNDYLQEKIEVEEHLYEIMQRLNKIKDDRLKYVLIYKFTEFKSLEEIADIMGYSMSQTFRFYKDAIKSIEL